MQFGWHFVFLREGYVMHSDNFKHIKIEPFIPLCGSKYSTITTGPTDANCPDCLFLYESKKKPRIVAYTIGNAISYDRDLAAQDLVTKIGKTVNIPDEPDYLGGWAWRTYQEAQQFIDSRNDLGFVAKVYGLILPNDWGTDTYLGSDGVHHLLHDAQIVQVKKHYDS